MFSRSPLRTQRRFRFGNLFPRYLQLCLQVPINSLTISIFVEVFQNRNDRFAVFGPCIWFYFVWWFVVNSSNRGSDWMWSRRLLITNIDSTKSYYDYSSFSFEFFLLFYKICAGWSLGEQLFCISELLCFEKSFVQKNVLRKKENSFFFLWLMILIFYWSIDFEWYDPQPST